MTIVLYLIISKRTIDYVSELQECSYISWVYFLCRHRRFQFARKAEHFKRKFLLRYMNEIEIGFLCGIHYSMFLKVWKVIVSFFFLRRFLHSQLLWYETCCRNFWVSKVWKPKWSISTSFAATFSHILTKENPTTCLFWENLYWLCSVSYKGNF